MAYDFGPGKLGRSSAAPVHDLAKRDRLARWAGRCEEGRRGDFWGTIIGVGVVHVAAEEFVLCADDDSLSCRSSADDVSGGCVPV